MPLYLWERMAEPGETAWDMGRRRAHRETGGFSYRNATIVERIGKVAACLIGYPLAGQPEEIDHDTIPAMFVPLQELENLAPGTWDVNVLAVYPQFRGQGMGSQFLGIVERHAMEAGSSGLSIIVSDGNSGAVRLYERCGYRRKADRPMVKENWQNEGINWVLLVK